MRPRQDRGNVRRREPRIADTRWRSPRDPFPGANGNRQRTPVAIAKDRVGAAGWGDRVKGEPVRAGAEYEPTDNVAAQLGIDDQLPGLPVTELYLHRADD